MNKKLVIGIILAIVVIAVAIGAVVMVLQVITMKKH